MQYVILMLLGAPVTALAARRMLLRRARYRAMTEADATVLEVVDEPWPVPGKGGTVYRVRVRFPLPDGRTVTALSRNTVHAPGDYPPGSRERIVYSPDLPENCFILRDREYAGLIFLCFGIFVFLLGVILWIIDRI